MIRKQTKLGLNCFQIKWVEVDDSNWTEIVADGLRIEGERVLTLADLED